MSSITYTIGYEVLVAVLQGRRFAVGNVVKIVPGFVPVNVRWPTSDAIRHFKRRAFFHVIH